jgi:hypothetical protein
MCAPSSPERSRGDECADAATKPLKKPKQKAHAIAWAFCFRAPSYEAPSNPL